jgi:hypothetical protein
MDKTLLNVNDKIIASDKAGEALLYRDRIATDSGTLLTFDETESEIRNIHSDQEYDGTDLFFFAGGIKLSKLYSVEGNDFTFSRSGEATQTNKNGTVTTVPANTPVINYLNGNLLGYLSDIDQGGRGVDVATASGLNITNYSTIEFEANFPPDYELVIAGLVTIPVDTFVDNDELNNAYATATWDEATSSPDIVVVNKNYAMRKIRLELTPTTKTLFVNDVQVDSQTGTYTWQPITEIELGHFNGEEQVEFEIKNLRIK